MPKYREIRTKEAAFLVEVEPAQADEDPSSTTRRDDLLNIIRAVSDAATRQLNELPPEHRPLSAEVCFGVKILETGSWAITLDRERANFRVKLSLPSSSLDPTT